MEFLSSTEGQFIITTCIGIIAIFISIWAALRRPVQIPISYEALSIEPVNGSKEELKELLETMHLSIDDEEAITYPCFVTFKIWNSGKESVCLPDADKPLVIAFNSGERILGCESIETVPDDLEGKLTYRTDDEKLLVNFPLLDPKWVMIFRVVLSNYVYYFPEIYVWVSGRKRIVRANNVRMSKEELIGALFYLFTAILCFKIIFTGSFFQTPNTSGKFLFIGTIVLFLLTGLLLLISSWVSRKSAPYSESIMLPSTMLFIYFKLFLYALPVLITFGVVAGIIYVFFGGSVLSIVFLIFCCLYASFGMWYWLRSAVFNVLRKTNKTINSWFINIVTGLPSLAFIGLCVYIFVDLFLNR